MANNDKYQIPHYVLADIQKTVNKYRNQPEQPKGYDELVRYLGLKQITKSQINKIVSFADNYQPSDLEQRQKKQLYGKLIGLAQNQQKSIRTKEKLSNQIRLSTDHPTGATTKNQTNRNVDRLSKPNKNAVKPPPIEYYGKDALKEEIQRIIALF